MQMIASTYGAGLFVPRTQNIGRKFNPVNGSSASVCVSKKPTNPTLTPTVGVSLITRSVCLSRAKVGALMCRRPDDRLMTTGVGGRPLYTQRSCDEDDQYQCYYYQYYKFYQIKIFTKIGL